MNTFLSLIFTGHHLIVLLIIIVGIVLLEKAQK